MVVYMLPFYVWTTYGYIYVVEHGIALPFLYLQTFN